MAASFEEVLRIALKIAGLKEAADLGEALKELGQASEEVKTRSTGMLDELANAQKTTKAIETYRGVSASVLRLSRELPAAREKVAELGRAISATTAPTAKQTAEFDRARASLTRLEGRYDTQRAKLSQLRKELQAQGVATGNLSAAEKQLADRKQALIAAVQREAEASKRARAEAEASAKAKRKQAEAESAAAAATEQSISRVKALTAAIAAGLAGKQIVDVFAGAVDSAREFERELDGVKAVTGANADEMARFRAAAEQAASTTKFTALEAAQALGELARATGSASTAIAALPATTALAQAAGLELAESAQFITTALTQFGLGADQAGRVADVLSKAANSTTADVRGLGLALSYAAPLARQLGLNLEQTTAIIGAMADQGFRGERAGTALRNVFSQLTDPTSQFRIALLGAGVAGGDFIEIIDGLSKSGEAGKRALMSLDAEARPAILALVNQGAAGIKQLRAQLVGAKGDAEATAKTMSDNFDGAVLRFTSAIDAARRALVDPLLEPLKREFDEAAVRVQAFIKTAEFESLRQSVKTFVLSAADALKQFLTSVDFNQLSTSISNFAASAKELFTGIKENADSLVAGLRIVVNVVSVMFNGLQIAIGTAAATVTTALANMVGAALQAVEAINKVLPAYAKQDEAVAKLAAKYDALKQTADDLWKGVAKDSADLADDFGDLADAAADVGESAKDAKPHLGALGEAAKKAAEDFKPVIQDLGLFPDYTRKVADGVSVVLGPLRDLSRDATLTAQSLIELDAAGRPIDPMLELLRTNLNDASAEFARLLQSADRTPESLAAANAAFNRAAEELRDYELAQRGAAAASEALQTAAAALGVKGLKDLETAVAQAKAGLDAYIQAARDGVLSQEAVNQAFEIYAQRQLELAQASGASARARILAELQVQAAITGNIGKLDELIAKYDGLSRVKPPVPPPVQAVRQYADETARAGSEAEKLGQKAEHGAKQATTALTGVAGGINGIRGAFAATSEAAAKFFDDLVYQNGRALSSLNVGDAFDGMAGRVTRAVEATQLAIDRQRAGVIGLIATLNQMGTEGPEAFERLHGSVDSMLSGLDSLELGIQNGSDSLRLLGQEDLGPLQSALDGARQRVRALEDQARGAKQALRDMADASQDAVDQASGNIEAVEQRRYQEQLARISELEREGGASAAAEAERARRLAAQEHQIRLSELQERKREQIRADDEVAENRRRNEGSSSPPPTSSSSGGGQVRRDGPQLPAMNINFNGRRINASGSFADLSAFAQMLAQAARNSGHGAT